MIARLLTFSPACSHTPWLLRRIQHLSINKRIIEYENGKMVSKTKYSADGKVTEKPENKNE